MMASKAFPGSLATAAIGARETGRSGATNEVPVELLAPLFVLMLSFGLFLTVLLPFAYTSDALSALRRSDEAWHAVWLMALAVLSFFVLLRWCAVQTMAFVASYRQQDGHKHPPGSWPFVSILVPAYQESGTIQSALRSLIELDYPAFEIIVIDDGSADDTYAKAVTFEGNHGRCSVRVLRKANGGKWSALNLAFTHASGEHMLCIDADSRLRADALRLLVARMDRPDIAGVSGQISVRNRCNIVTRLQAYEYVVANGGLRTAQGLLGMVLVVPGPIGLYRRAVLQEVFEKEGRVDRTLRDGEVQGPYSHETFAEDFQLSLTILALGYRIVYEPRALSYTKSPELTQSLLSQRYRWFRGNMQVLRLYARRLRHIPGPQRRRLGLLIAAIYPLDLYILPAINFAIFSGVLVAAATSATLADLLLWVSAIWLLNLLSATYHILSQRDDLSLLYLVPVYDLYHGLLLASAWAIAIVDEVRQSRMHW
jgi:biofilm PGA synthesis N-glycosyltransferase PgaC